MMVKRSLESKRTLQYLWWIEHETHIYHTVCNYS